jgi:hypothetical protein
MLNGHQCILACLLTPDWKSKVLRLDYGGIIQNTIESPQFGPLRSSCYRGRIIRYLEEWGFSRHSTASVQYTVPRPQKL